MHVEIKEDALDAAQRFSRELDRIPGFRARNPAAPLIDWSLRNPTRRMAVMAFGGGAAFVAASLALGAWMRRRPVEERDDRAHAAA